jgi:hypothetical protein
MDLHIPELDNLRDLLTDLPNALPCPSEWDSDYPFLSVELDDAVLQRTNGDVPRHASLSAPVLKLVGLGLCLV